MGVTRTHRVTVATPADPLRLVCGRRLDHVEVAYETYGTLNPAADNVVYLCHALTADAHAAGVDAGTGQTGWWDALIGPGRAIDTDRFFVVCGNLLGSPNGTTAPTASDPSTGRPYGIDFPPIHIADQVAVHRRLCSALGVRSLHAVIGPSLGGMHAIQWAIEAPAEVRSTILIATSSALSVENRAFSAAGRQAIIDDPGFEDGRYLETGGPGPVRGLAAARRFAHITYVSAEALERKLADAPPTEWPPKDAAEWLAPAREVERYLEHQGRSFLGRFDALCYLFLTRPMDDFEPFHPSRADRARAALSSQPQARHLLISFTSDWRFGTGHSLRAAQHLREAGAGHVAHHELDAPWGHDSFLVGAPGMPELIAEALGGLPTG